MKDLRANAGPFEQRPYFAKSEIEKICIAELQTEGLLPDEPGPVRIDRFIERRFNASPSW